MIAKLLRRKGAEASTPPVSDPRAPARHLLHLLGEGAAPGGAPPRAEELRAMAAALVAQVEGRSGQAGSRVSDPAPRSRGSDGRAASGTPAPEPPVPGRAVPDGPRPVARAARAQARRLFTAPSAAAHASAAAVPAQATDDGRPATLVVPAPVADLLGVAEARSALGQEHPALVAAHLAPRDRRAQAAALRALPGPTARAVHGLLVAQG